MRTSDRRSRTPLLVLAAASALLVVLLYLVFVGTIRGQRLDNAAMKGRQTLDSQQIKDADELLRTIDIASVALIGGAIALVAVARHRPERALAAATVIVGANVTTQVMKWGLPGPSLFTGEDADKNFFPSGHATVAMSLALAAVLVASTRTRDVVAVFGALYAAAIGVATLTAGWHRPSDAIGGFAVVTAWAALVAGTGPRRRGVGKPRAKPVAPSLLLISGLILASISFAVLVAVLFARRSGRLGAIPLGSAYIGGAFTIAAAAFVLTGALLVAIRLAAARPRPQRPVPEPVG